MIAQFSNQQLQGYKSEFRPGLEAATLEKTEKRYLALRRLLKSYEEQYGCVFPADWKVPSKMCEDFCRVTKTHLTAVLDRTGPGGPDVAVLLHVLQKTIEFEQELG